MPHVAAPHLPPQCLPLYPCSCPTGTITLHLIAGNIQDPYAVCFPTFNVTVTESNNRCLLRVSPDAIANTLKWGNETDSNGAEVRWGRAATASGWLNPRYSTCQTPRAGCTCGLV